MYVKRQGGEGSLCVFLSYGAVEVTLLEKLNVNFILKTTVNISLMIKKPQPLILSNNLSAQMKCMIYRHVKYSCVSDV